MSKRKDHIEEVLKDGDRVERAAERAVREALRRHKLQGSSIVVWRDGKVVWVPPEEIEVEADPKAAT